MIPSVDQDSHNGSHFTCGFCGKSRHEVRTLMISNKNVICEECIAAGLEAFIRDSGRFSLRLALWAFKIIGSIGRFLGI
jgi:hypothetical protein